MSKRKSAPARKPRQIRRCGPTPEQLDQIILLVISGLPETQIAAAATEKLGIEAAAVATALDQARQRIALAATVDRTQAIGTALARMNDLYRRSLAIQDTKTALGAQRELNRLLQLYATDAAAPGGSAEPAGDAEAIAAGRRQLLSLGLGADDDPIDELCRLTVARLVELEGAIPEEPAIAQQSTKGGTVAGPQEPPGGFPPPDC